VNPEYNDQFGLENRSEQHYIIGSLNPETEETGGNDASDDPTTFFAMLFVVMKLSVGPIISMFFYMFV